MDYSEVIEFVKKETSENDKPDSYPFKSRYEHTMRVYRWAIRLQAKLGGDLDVIVLAALLHDIGWSEDGPCAETSAEVAVEYLDSIGVSPEMIVQVGEIIMMHDDKDTEKDLSLECRIVMDADLLDEVGAVAILGSSMAVAADSDSSYKRAYYKIKEFYRTYKPKMSLCKTETGRTEFGKRLQFIENYIYQLERELF
ncbi:MAG: HD domain-containing protein [Eubacterium sp.]|nr:HD domain-containing protein [Eubacterium sp.]